MAKDKRQHIVVVGGGYAGLTAALECARYDLGAVTLISDQSYMTHHATLYATATGHDPRESALPLRDIVWYHPGVRLVRDTITEIDPHAKTVRGKKAYSYDVLIMAVGLVDHFSHVAGAERYGTTIATHAAAQECQRTLHQSLINTPRGVIRMAIIGGGQTGVELAGAAVMYGRAVTRAHGLPETSLEVTLIEAGSRLVPRLSRYASRCIAEQLTRMGVRIVVRRSVDRVTRRSIVLDGQRSPVDIVAWTCGGRNHPLFMQHHQYFRIAPSGRVVVNQYLQAYPHIFVIGDNARTPDTGTAAAAIDHARFVARHLRRLQHGKTLRCYRPARHRHLITVPITRTRAYSEYRGIVVTGLLGAIVRRWSELRRYRQFLPFFEAWRTWRRHTHTRSRCRLCEK